jgi:hypothetical protein
MFYGARRDTRRKRHGKVLGGHCGSAYAGRGRIYKSSYWRAERRYWKAVARLHLGSVTEYEVDESRIRMSTLSLWRSELIYKGW